MNTKDSDDVAPTLNSVCQSDGQWSKDILNYQCLGNPNVSLSSFVVVKILTIRLFEWITQD